MKSIHIAVFISVLFNANSFLHAASSIDGDTFREHVSVEHVAEVASHAYEWYEDGLSVQLVGEVAVHVAVEVFPDYVPSLLAMGFHLYAGYDQTKNTYNRVSTKTLQGTIFAVASGLSASFHAMEFYQLLFRRGESKSPVNIHAL